MEAFIALLGNVTTHFSVERRKNVMKHMSFDLSVKINFLSVVLIYLERILDPKQRKQQITIQALKGVTIGFSRFGGSKKESSPRAIGTFGARVHKPHRVQCSAVSVPQSKPRRSNKCTSTLTQPFTYNNAGTDINMSMGPVHYLTHWFSAASIFPTSSTSGPQSVIASWLPEQCST